jgi:hypothetical protein
MPNCPPIKEGTDNPPDNYPKYLKEIFKEVDMDKDENLKKCKCKLKIPLDDDFCMITDEDKKWAIFPFCTEYHPEADGPPQDYSYIKLTIKEAMEFYWKTKILEININYKDWDCSACYPEQFDGCCVERSRAEPLKLKRYFDSDPEKEIDEKKKLVCANYLEQKTPWESQPNFGDFNFFHLPNFYKDPPLNPPPRIWINKKHIYLPVACSIVFGDESDGIFTTTKREKCDWCINECAIYRDPVPEGCEKNCKKGTSFKIKKKYVEDTCYYADSGPIEHQLELDANIEEFKFKSQ